MPRREGQKAKLLALLEVLVAYTDEEHPVSVPQLVEMLQARGIDAERKSIYADIEALREYGFDIELRRGRGGGYYMEGVVFQLAELKLLVDAVQASKFITQRKSRQLIDKLEHFTSRYRAEALKRQVLVGGRIKSVEETIYYSVDGIHRAISKGRQISFVYRDWDVNKRMTSRHEGQSYQVSPWALVWENGNYYLIAAREGSLRHFRVDKMFRVTVLENVPRAGAELYAGFDVNRYVQQTFGMFSGPVRRVRLRCDNRFSGPMVDRFGKEPAFVPVDGEHFEVTVEVQVSNQFYGWVCGFGGGVQVVEPADVRAELRAYLEKLLCAYTG